MCDGLTLVYDDESGTWGEAPETYGSIAFDTQEAFENALDILKNHESYVNAIYAELAELYGSPCNFSPMDDYMLENGQCNNCCGDIPDKECWKRYFELKLKQ